MLLCNNSYAQIRKAPATDDDQAETQQINKDVVKAHVADFTEVIFKRNQDHRLDTDEVFKVTYYPKGLVKEYTSYSYETADKMMNNPPFDQIKTHVAKGDRTRYEYDNNGNVTTIKDYDVVSANSFMAVYTTLQKQYELEKLTNRNGAENRDPEQAKKKLQESVAAIIQKGVPEEAILIDENDWSYDADGNTTYKTEGLDHKTSHYKYTYNAEGRPTSKTEIYINTQPGSVPYFSTIVYTFSYTSKGKPESISTYLAEQDSVNIVQEKYLVRQQTLHYTEKGQTDTITYKQKGIIIKHIMAYDDTLRTGYTIIVMHPKRLDTSTYITYQYDGVDLSEMKQWIYNEGRTGEYEVSRYSYNDKHLPIEMKKYVLGAKSTREELTEQDLFFYGVPSEDKRTAKRSLREEKPK